MPHLHSQAHRILECPFVLRALNKSSANCFILSGFILLVWNGCRILSGSVFGLGQPKADLGASVLSRTAKSCYCIPKFRFCLENPAICLFCTLLRTDSVKVRYNIGDLIVTILVAIGFTVDLWIAPFFQTFHRRFCSLFEVISDLADGCCSNSTTETCR